MRCDAKSHAISIKTLRTIARSFSATPQIFNGFAITWQTGNIYVSRWRDNDTRTIWIWILYTLRKIRAIRFFSRSSLGALVRPLVEIFRNENMKYVYLCHCAFKFVFIYFPFWESMGEEERERDTDRKSSRQIIHIARRAVNVTRKYQTHTYIHNTSNLGIWYFKHTVLNANQKIAIHAAHPNTYTQQSNIDVLWNKQKYYSKSVIIIGFCAQKHINTFTTEHINKFVVDGDGERLKVSREKCLIYRIDRNGSASYVFIYE